MLDLSNQNRFPPKLVPPDQFWQKIAKSGPPGPILAAKNGPPWETKFGKHILAKIDPPSKTESLYPAHACILIKTHDSESRGQEEAGRTRRMSVLFTGNTAMKFVNALNKPP